MCETHSLLPYRAHLSAAHVTTPYLLLFYKRSKHSSWHRLQMRENLCKHTVPWKQKAPTFLQSEVRGHGPGTAGPPVWPQAWPSPACRPLSVLCSSWDTGHSLNDLQASTKSFPHPGISLGADACNLTATKIDVNKEEYATLGDELVTFLSCAKPLS